MSHFDEHLPRITSSALPGSTYRTEQAEDLADETQADFYTPRPSTSRLHQGRALVWEVAQTVLLTIAIFLSVRLVVQNFRVEGASMDPTLRSGQFLLINKAAFARADSTPLEAVVPPAVKSSVHYVFGGPQRGDIIVFRSPNSDDKDFIKRVIGLPGDTVKIQDGRVYINGKQLSEPYIKNKATYDLDSKKVPSDSYFVLGDNRPNSSDSHVWGFVPADKIIGKAWVSYWPPNLWGVLDPAAYANVD